MTLAYQNDIRQNNSFSYSLTSAPCSFAAESKIRLLLSSEYRAPYGDIIATASRLSHKNAVRQSFDSAEEFVLPFVPLYENLQKLSQMRLLENGWDGYYAIPIYEAAISNAIAIIKELSQQPFLVPTCRGTVQIEYEKPDSDYIEYEICENEVRGFRMNPQGRFQKWQIKVNDDIAYVASAIAEEIEAFFNGAEFQGR